MTSTKKPAAKVAKKPVPQKAAPGRVIKPLVAGKAKPPVAPAAKKGFPPRKTGAQAKRPARKPLPVFKAPADFKPHFLLVQFVTEKDGLIGSTIKATRYQGRFDASCPARRCAVQNDNGAT